MTHATKSKLDSKGKLDSGLDAISVEDLQRDPYPIFDQIRDMGSAVWVKSARIHLVTRFEDVQEVERRPDLFASTNPGSLMNVVMGHSLMRKDFDEHRRERKAIEPAFRPRNIKAHLEPHFRVLVEELIDGIAAQGTADLFPTFAEPLAARALAHMIGFRSVAWKDLANWSQALMDGVGNYQGDPELSRRAKQASDAIDAAIAEVIETYRATPNESIISAMVNAPDPHTVDQVRANVKVIVGGGLNEPRDAILTLLFALLSHPEQLQAVRQDPDLIRPAFEEAVRWVSPIGMYPRRVTQNTVLGDTELEQGTQIGICVGAANRDPRKFQAPQRFDLFRKPNHHLAFGAGAHFCAGTWVARALVAQIAVPRLLERLVNLRLAPDSSVVERGWVFRGPTRLEVQWDLS